MTTALGKMLQADRVAEVEPPGQHRAGCAAVEWQELQSEWTGGAQISRCVERTACKDCRYAWDIAGAQ